MVLTVHHLGVAQSDRIVWLCEELDIPYDLKLYKRNPLFSPPELASLTPLGTAPVLEDTNSVTGQSFKITECGAIVEYIINVHGDGRLALTPKHANYPDYLFWFHFANGSLLPTLGRKMFLRSVNATSDSPMQGYVDSKIAKILTVMEDRLAETNAWLAGDEFTAADIMNVFCLTTFRYYNSINLGGYPNILAYLQRVGQREKYQAAMAKGDPEMDWKKGLTAEGPELHHALAALENRAGSGQKAKV